MSISIFVENLRSIRNLYIKYSNNPNIAFNETLISNYKNVFPDNLSNNLLNLVNLQNNFENSKFLLREKLKLNLRGFH